METVVIIPGNLAFYLQHCQVSETENELIIEAPSALIARGLQYQSGAIAKILESNFKEKGRIRWRENGQTQEMSIPAWISICSDELEVAEIEEPEEEDSSMLIVRGNQLVIPQNQDAEILAIASADNERANWIIDQRTQKVLFANRVALAANGNKPPEEMLLSDISALWEEAALQSLTELVHRDKVVTDHTNDGYRWAKRDDRYVRVPYTFCVDYREFNFLGNTARFEVVKEALPRS